jgi:hypothetical protein
MMRILVLVGLLTATMAFASSTTCPPGKCLIQNSCKPCVTSTTSPPTTTPSTTRPPATQPSPPPTALTPTRFIPFDVSLAYYADPQDIHYDAHDGSWASQYVMQSRIEFAWLVEGPPVLRAMRDLKCQGIPSPSTIQDDLGKFLIWYCLKAVGEGGPCPARPNYLVDRWRGLMVAFAACFDDSRAWYLDAHPELRELVAPGLQPTPRQDNPSKVHGLDGELDGRTKFQPLNDEQCDALDRARAAHHAHGNCLLAHGSDCSSFGARVRPAQLAFESTARTVNELSLFSLIFSGDIDPTLSQERVDYYTEKTMASYDVWADAFGCADHSAPMFFHVLQGRWMHARYHFLRAIAGIPIREVNVNCGTVDNRCPITED